MRYFSKELNRVLSEMAQLSGWNPTKEYMFVVSLNHNGEIEEQDFAYGENPNDAIAKFVNIYNHEELEKIANIYGMTAEQYAASLTAKPASAEEVADSSAFSKRDVRSINDERTRAAIEKWLNDNPTPYHWIIYFGGTGSRIEPTPGAITFVKHGNAGGDTLTAHMILHTIGHAVVYYDTEDLIDTLRPVFAPVTGNDDEDSMMMDLCKLLHMKAAAFTLMGHKRGFPDFNEMVYEIMAIYIKNGRIKIAPNKYCDYPATPEFCATIKATLENYCRTKLDSKVGRVVWDE